MKRFGKRVSFVMGLAALQVFGLVAAAFAQTSPAGDVTAEITGALGDLRTIVLGVIGAFFALVIVGVAIRVGAKYTKRGGANA